MISLCFSIRLSCFLTKDSLVFLSSVLFFSCVSFNGLNFLLLSLFELGGFPFMVHVGDVI